MNQSFSGSLALMLVTVTIVGCASGHDGHGGGGGIGGPCWTASDCQSAICTMPGQHLCAGVCPALERPCTDDSQCLSDGGAVLVCDVEPCTCPAGKGCTFGCTRDLDCADPAGTTCSADHHCVRRPCASGGPACPTDLTCGTDGYCARKTCASDAQCSNACVLGACFGRPGTCMLAVP